MAVDAAREQVASVMTSNQSSDLVLRDGEDWPMDLVSTRDVTELLAAAYR